MKQATRVRQPGAGRLRSVRTRLPVGVSSLTFNSKPGLLAAIHRLREAEIQAANDYTLALTTGDADLVARKKKDWLDLVESLRKVEQSNPDIEKANANTLPVDLVETETARMVNAFRVSLESLARSLPQRLVGADEVTIHGILEVAVNDCLEQLHTKEWKVNA